MEMNAKKGTIYFTNMEGCADAARKLNMILELASCDHSISLTSICEITGDTYDESIPNMSWSDNRISNNIGLDCYKDSLAIFLNLDRSTVNNILEDCKKKEDASFNPVLNPSHYCEGRKYEPRKVIEDWGLDFYLGNTLKYIARAGRKGGNAEKEIEDLNKAKQYIDFKIESLKGE